MEATPLIQREPHIHPIYKGFCHQLAGVYILSQVLQTLCGSWDSCMIKSNKHSTGFDRGSIIDKQSQVTRNLDTLTYGIYAPPNTRSFSSTGL
jgi:hypothetical protein